VFPFYKFQGDILHENFSKYLKIRKIHGINYTKQLLLSICCSTISKWEVPAMTAVIYARYSSDNQREESIEGQIRECTAYAEKNGITVVKHYIL